MYVHRDESGRITAIFSNEQEGFAEEFVEGAPIELSSEQFLTQKMSAVQSHIDTIAKSIGYDDIYAACTYAEEPAVPRFQIEGRALRAWRSLVWAKCHEVMAEVTNGKREIPTDEQLIGLLPKFTTPKA